MKIKLKKHEVLDLFRFIAKTEVSENDSKRFNYAIVYTEESIKPTAGAIVSISKPKQSYALYENSREELCRKYVETDHNGKYVKGANYTLVLKKDTEDEAKKEFEELDSKYADILEERTNDLKEYMGILDEICEIDVEQFDIEDIPDRLNNKDGLKALKPLIKRL